MRTVDYTPHWTVRRVGCIADVSCETSVLLDANDVMHYAIRVALNGQPIYERVYSRHGDAERDAAETLTDLLAAGWRDDVDWMRSTAVPVERAA